MEWVVHFTWKHKGFFWFHETKVFEAKNRIGAVNQVLRHIIVRESDGYHFVSCQLDQDQNPTYET